MVEKKKLIWGILFILVLMMEENSFAEIKVSGPLGSIIVDEVTREESERIFSWIKEKSDLHHKSDRGCEDRCYLVNYRVYNHFKKRMVKVGIMPTDTKYLLEVEDPTHRQEMVSWHYHIANALFVEGKMVVFDPTFFDGPIKLEEWLNFLSKERKEFIGAETSNIFLHPVVYFYGDFAIYHPGEVFHHQVPTFERKYSLEVLRYSMRNITKYWEEQENLLRGQNDFSY